MTLSFRPLLAPALLALILIVPHRAAAAGQALIEARDEGQQGQVQIEYDDAGRVRIDPLGEAAGQGYLVVREGKAYSVARVEGQLMVMDMGAMMKMMGGLMAQQGLQAPKLGSEGMVRLLSLEDAGRSETVAGLSGRVHTLRYVDAQGKTREETLVLSADARVRALSAAMIAMGEVMTRLAATPPQPGADALAAELKSRGQGLLRFGSQFAVVRLSADTPAASRFELPAAPMELPDFGGLLGG
ncbi:MAG TPA: hypothetical protein VFV27_03350 [Nevskiaceae bacterium]|nr:hypothetical protein [Nevskiaceae bacterium]